MIDTISNTSYFSVVWQYFGPLLGVGFGYLISYKVWNRQRQWELKRDVILDVVRSLADLEGAVNEFDGASSKPPGNLPEEAAKALRSKKSER